MKFLFLFALIFLVGCSHVSEVQNSNSGDNMEDSMAGGTNPVGHNSNTPDDTVTPVDKVFMLTGENFKFTMNSQENPELRVKEGDKVRIEFTSTSGFHDWVVDEFNAKTNKLQSGNSHFVEFTADKKGTFEYYCSVGNHRAQGMKGNLIVE